MSSTPFPPLRLAWMTWGFGALLYVISFYQRVAPGVITDELMTDFALNAAALGNLSAFYFYSYVAMQIPTGVIADHWGPRKLLTLGALVAGLGTFLFALAPDVWWANAGRLLIGGSVAVAFVGILKLAGHWMPAKQFALASGMALFFGIIGAVLAGVPLRLLVDAFGWRPIMLASAVVTCLVGIGIWWFVRDDPKEKGYASYAYTHSDDGVKISLGVLAGIREVFRYRNAWLLYFIPGAVTGSTITFAGLWGVPFFSTHYGMEKTTAAAMCSILLVAWAIGGPIYGWLSDHLGHRKPLYILGVVMLLIGWGVIFLVPNLPLGLLIVLLIVVGFFSGNMIISFAFARESAPPQLAGTASGIVNMGVMMGPMLTQPGIGWLLDLAWQGETVGAVRIYSLQAYQNAFMLMLGWLALALVLLLFTRETHCRQMVR